MPNPITDTPIIDTDYATLWYHPDTKIVHHVFHKFIYGDEFRSVLNTRLDAFKQYGAQNGSPTTAKIRHCPLPILSGASTIGFIVPSIRAGSAGLS